MNEHFSNGMPLSHQFAGRLSFADRETTGCDRVKFDRAAFDQRDGLIKFAGKEDRPDRPDFFQRFEMQVYRHRGRLDKGQNANGALLSGRVQRLIERVRAA